MILDANHASGSRVRYIILMTVSLLSIVPVEPANAGNATAPEIQEGLLDLSDWSFDEDGPVVLGGPWEFWWGELLTQESREPNGLYTVPGYWNGRFIEGTGSEAPGQGCATLDFESNCLGRWTMSLEFISVSQSAPHLFVQDADTNELEPVVVVGEAACVKDSEIPLWLPKVATLQTLLGGREISLWWHVSNHHFARGGPLISPVIGNLSELKGNLLFERLRDAFLIGILVIMALYHLGIFSQRTKDTTSLWFGLLCLVVAVRQISTSRFIEILAQPASSAQFEAREMLEYGSMILGLPLAMLFVASLIPGRWIQRIAYAVSIGCALYLVMILTQPAQTYSAWVDYYQAMLFVSMTVFVLHALSAWFKGNRLAGLTLMGFTPMVLAATNDVLVGKGYLETPFLSPYGFGALILIQSYILASRFSQAYRNGRAIE